MKLKALILINGTNRKCLTQLKPLERPLSVMAFNANNRKNEFALCSPR